jgi:hypothetical protein
MLFGRTRKEKKMPLNTEKYSDGSVEIWKDDTMIGEYGPANKGTGVEWSAMLEDYVLVGVVENDIKAACNILSVNLDGVPIYNES